MDEKEYSSQKSFSIVRLLGGLYLLYLSYCIISEEALEPPLQFISVALIGFVGIFFIVSAYRSFVTIQNRKKEAERNRLAEKVPEESDELPEAEGNEPAAEEETKQEDPSDQL